MNIQNEKLSLTVTLNAAEMTSLIDKKTGKEILWNGDPAYWAGRNPILFPIVGSTFDKKIHLFGKEYVMGNHGFTRNSVFTQLSQTENQITLRLIESELTLAQYPFKFSLTVCYTLESDCVNIDYLIENTDDKKMPFSFGLHPAFALDDPDAALLRFPETETDPDHGNTFKEVLMNDAFFKDRPTFLLEKFQSPYVDLVRGDRSIRVSCDGYRWLAFWKKPGATFLCIEPWHGHADFSDQVTADFTKREGTIILDPHQSFYTSYSITIL
jgi:galactose mutarotase-like enzyme